MHQPPIPHVASTDPEIAGLIEGEARRQFEKVRLIPSENYASAAVLEATGSVLTNKYSEGYPGRRYYEGQQFIDPIETLARQRAQALFGVDHANVQPYSGSPANLAVYLAFLQPGETVMGMALPMGGHLTHGWPVSVTGKWFRAVQYGVRADTGRLDLDQVRDLARAERPKIIFCGGTAIPRTIDFPAFAEIAGEIGAILVADIAHIAGLIAGGAHPSPVGYAPVITTTTHKTLRGPRGAMIMSAAEYASPLALDRAGIETNYNTVPFDPRRPFDPSGLRIGTPAITTRGLREEHMSLIAAWMDEAITAAAKEDEPVLERIAAEVRDLMAGFPMPGWVPASP